jgi:hypothetical protein
MAGVVAVATFATATLRCFFFHLLFVFPAWLTLLMIKIKSEQEKATREKPFHGPEVATPGAAQ